MIRLGAGPPPMCVCGHPPDAHQPWGERNWMAQCCQECGCSIFEQDYDR